MMLILMDVGEGALCVDSPCKYPLKVDCCVTKYWLKHHVIPVILKSNRIQESIALVLLLVPNQIEQNGTTTLQASYAQNVALRQELNELRAKIQQMNEQFMQYFNLLDSSVHQIAVQPVVCRVQQHNDNATLMKNPCLLYVLWQEYEFGVGNCKPVWLFTTEERSCEVRHHP